MTWGVVAAWTASIVVMGMAASAQVLEPPIQREGTLDGVVSTNEQSGQAFALSGGGRLWLARTPDGLYVGLQPGDVGMAHICVAIGDRVNVLHSSASLGTATYAITGTVAQRLMPFTWQQPTDLRAFLTAHRWTGTLPTGAGTEREFLLGPEWATSGVIRLAVVYGGVGPVRHWPATVSDDCTQTGLLFGEAPPAAVFRPADWASVRVAGAR